MPKTTAKAGPTENANLRSSALVRGVVELVKSELRFP